MWSSYDFNAFLAFWYFPIFYKAIYNFEYLNLKRFTSLGRLLIILYRLRFYRLWCGGHRGSASPGSTISRSLCRFSRVPAGMPDVPLLEGVTAEGCQAGTVATHCTWAVSHNPACCQAFEPYLPELVFLHRPGNVRGAGWGCLTPFEDTVGQRTKADAGLLADSEPDQPLFLPCWGSRCAVAVTGPRREGCLDPGMCRAKSMLWRSAQILPAGL